MGAPYRPREYVPFSAHSISEHWAEGLGDSEIKQVKTHNNSSDDNRSDDNHSSLSDGAL